MKNKHGFTLIELLAVIVILAIIALIATPIVLNLIEKSRQGAARNSAYGVRKAAQLYYQTILLDDISGINGSVTISFDNGVITSTSSNQDVLFEMDGTIPKGGSIIITNNGEISGTVIINGYTCVVPNSGTISCIKGEELTPVTYRKYNDGEIVYYNPTTNKFCSNYNIDNSITEYKGDTTSKTTDNQTGCLKWYAYLDSEESETVKLLLDHNTSDSIKWYDTSEYKTLSESNIQPLLNSLKNNSGWVLQPTIISATDIALITDYAGTNGVDWDSSNVRNWFNFDTNTTTNETPLGTYWWLYDRIGSGSYLCTDYGCHTNGSNSENNGYWTSTNVAETVEVWGIRFSGALSQHDSVSTWRGIRPVVTVNKNVGHDGTSRVYYNGEIVYFNPVTNTQCYNYVEDNSTTGYKGENDPNKTDSQTGCMRWFAYLDNGNATDLKLLADHNTTATITWYDTAEYKTLEESNLQSELNDLVDDNVYDWNVPTTIISATDIALITNYAETNGVDWDSTSTSNLFYFDTNTNERPNTYSETYWWIFDRTKDCENYGCITGDNSNNGYWSSLNINQNSSWVWGVGRTSIVGAINSNETPFGIRPVITISKSLLD